MQASVIHIGKDSNCVHPSTNQAKHRVRSFKHMSTSSSPLFLPLSNPPTFPEEKGTGAVLQATGHARTIMPENKLVTTVSATPRPSAGPLSGVVSEPALDPLLELLLLLLDPPDDPFAVPVEAAPERVADPVPEPEIDAATEEVEATQSGHPPLDTSKQDAPLPEPPAFVESAAKPTAAGVCRKTE